MCPSEELVGTAHSSAFKSSGGPGIATISNIVTAGPSLQLITSHDKPKIRELRVSPATTCIQGDGNGTRGRPHLAQANKLTTEKHGETRTMSHRRLFAPGNMDPSTDKHHSCITAASNSGDGWSRQTLWYSGASAARRRYNTRQLGSFCAIVIYRRHRSTCRSKLTRSISLLLWRTAR